MAASQRRRRGAGSVELGGERRGPLLELGRRLLEPLRLRPRARRRARPARRARRRLRRRGGSDPRPPRAPRTAGAAPRSAARRPAAAPLRGARSRRALPPAADRARRALPRPDAARARAARASAPGAVCLVGRVLQLRLVADDRLFLPVLLGVQRRDRVRRLRDRRPRAPAVSCAERASASRSAADPAAQILDLALRFENAARLRASRRRTPGAGRGTHRRRASRPAAASARLASAARVVRRRDPGVADRAADGVRERAVDAHDRRQRDDALRQRTIGSASDQT